MTDQDTYTRADLLAIAAAERAEIAAWHDRQLLRYEPGNPMRAIHAHCARVIRSQSYRLQPRPRDTFLGRTKPVSLRSK